MACKVKREILAIARSIVPNATLHQSKGDHLCVEIEGPLGRRKLFTGLSASDKNRNILFRQDIRRVARQIGIPA